MNWMIGPWGRRLLSPRGRLVQQKTTTPAGMMIPWLPVQRAILKCDDSFSPQQPFKFRAFASVVALHLALPVENRYNHATKLTEAGKLRALLAGYRELSRFPCSCSNPRPYFAIWIDLPLQARESTIDRYHNRHNLPSRCTYNFHTNLCIYCLDVLFYLLNVSNSAQSLRTVVQALLLFESGRRWDIGAG